MFTQLVLVCVLAETATAQLMLPDGGRWRDPYRGLTTAVPGVDGSPLVYGGKKTLPKNVPWHAGIWKPQGPIYVHECGGTLIAPNLVVTAAHCFWNFTINAEIPDLHTYQVAVGKVYREWHLDIDSSAVQRIGVQSVSLDSRFDGYVKRYLENDIAIVRLADNVTLTEFVQLADVDFTVGKPPNGSVGVVAGWGYDESANYSHELRAIELPYIDYDTCYLSLGELRFKRLLTFDKFCAGFSNEGKSVCQGDSGGGFVTLDDLTKKPTVRGIVSNDFRPKEFLRDRCYALHYTSFTNIGVPRYLDWIRSQLEDAAGPVRCPAILVESGSGSVNCIAGSVLVNCSLPMTVATTAVLTCSIQHHIAESDVTQQAATCERNSSWSNVLECVPDCGRRDIRELSVDGETVTSDKPWFIIIYTRLMATDSWSYEAAGTLISTRHVVAAAYEVTYDNGTARAPTDMRVLAGSHLLDYDVTESDSQERDVTSVHIHDKFNRSSRIHDIALLLADEPFLMTWAINIACVDWSGRLKQPIPGQSVLTSGGRRGVNTTGHLIASQPATLNSLEQCVTSSRARHRHVSAHNLCARTTGSDTCGGDDGPALLVQRNTDRGARVFLLGVTRYYLDWTDSGDACVVNRLSSYTSVSSHTNWLRRFVITDKSLV